MFLGRRVSRGRKSRDEPSSGRPIEATSEDEVAAVEKLVLQNRSISIKEIMAERNLSYGTVERNFHDHQNLFKVAAAWVPKTLKPVEKAIRVQQARIVTGDEVWLHHYDPESEQQSKEWKHPGSPRKVRVHPEPREGKVMATIFWDAEGILLIDYVPKNTKITVLR